jgi:imidazolonepropionase-like amidohydrolase
MSKLGAEQGLGPGVLTRRDFLRLAASGLAAMAAGTGLLAGCCASSGEPATALVGGTLIDGTGAEPVPDGAVVIQGERIVAVGSHSQVTIPAGARVIEVQGAAILPGFIDAHVHAAFDRDHLESWAQSGVTTVKDFGNGGDRHRLFTFRDEVRGDPQYARLLTVGPYVTVPGGYPIVPWGDNALTVNSPEDARQKVGQLLDDGADMIKIAIESGTIFRESLPMLSPEEAAAIVELVHQRGTLVGAHVTVAKDLKRALDAGVDVITHMVGDYLPDELIARAVEAGICWTPTLGMWEDVDRRYPVHTKATVMNNLGRFAAAGGRVALGSDYGDYIAEFSLPIHEIELMQEAGMAPMDIVVAATQIAAQSCNLGQEIGTLEVGKAADLLIVDGDPLQDIRALTSTRIVLHSGMMIRE